MRSFQSPVGVRATLGRPRAVVYNLFEGIARFNELQRATGGISKRVLTAQLRQLERDSIVTRKVYDSSPLRVEYALTEVRSEERRVGKECRSWRSPYR